MKIEVTSGFMPERQHPGDAGYDIKSAENITLEVGDCRLINAGFKMKLPEGHEAQVRSRSGLTLNRQVIVLNSPGTLDTSYRGEVRVILANLGSSPFEIRKGDRIAQMVIAKYESPTMVKGKVSDNTERGDGGMGSTGK